MDITSFMPNLTIILYAGGIGLVGMFVFLFFFVFKKKGNLIVDLMEERADGSTVLVLTDAAVGIIKKKGQLEKWKILNTRIDPFEPKQKDRLIPHLGKKIDKAYLLRDKSGIIHIIKFDYNEKERSIVMQPDYRDPMNFMVEEYDERAKVKEANSTWKEFQPMMVGIVSLMIVFIAIFFSFKYAAEERASITTTIAAGKDEIKAYAAQYDDIIRKAAVIVANQEVLDKTNNWTTTHVVYGGK